MNARRRRSSSPNPVISAILPIDEWPWSIISCAASTRSFSTALAGAIERHAGLGGAIAQSTFHHFADYNWDPRTGCPGFVSEPPGSGMVTNPAALADIQRYVLNAAYWPAGD